MDRESISATEFKAKCLDILDQVSARQLGSVAITKRGRVVALLVPPPDEPAAVRQLYGFLRGTVVTPPGIDLTEPVLDEAFSAEEGELHA